MPAIWTAEPAYGHGRRFHGSTCHFIGGEGVFENDITVLPEMWEECLESASVVWGSIIRSSFRKQFVKSGLLQIKSLVHHHLRRVDSPVFTLVCGDLEGFGDGFNAR